MYATTFLPDAVFLLAKQCPLAGIHANGAGYSTFLFDVPESDAAALLQSAEAELCRVYHKTWRDTRRRLEGAQAAAHYSARHTATPTAKEK